MTHSQPARPLDVIRSPDTAMRLLQPLRRRILENLNVAQSATSLARRLGLARQKVNYHLRELEKDRLVELVEERRRGNCTERVVKATARSYLISPEVLGALGSQPEEIRDRFSAAYLVATAGRAVRDVAVLQESADEADQRLATLTLTSEVCFASAQARNAFAEELTKTLAELSAKYHDEDAPGGRRFRFFVGGHPAPAEDDHEQAAGREATNGKKGER